MPYKNLNKRIEDFQIVLPLLQELAKPSVMVRHWDELRVFGEKMILTKNQPILH